jgi:hypothetical protein
MSHKFLFFSALIPILILACNGKPEPGTAAAPGGKPIGEVSTGNYLSMKINGVEWKADNDLFGAFHPKGYNKAIIISGSKGPKNKDEQTFNINLYNTEGPGTYQFKTGNPDLNVAQLGNLSPANYMYGNVMGFDMTVKVTKASTNPDIIEATFEGSLNGNAGDVLKVTEGKFYYHE